MNASRGRRIAWKILVPAALVGATALGIAAPSASAATTPDAVIAAQGSGANLHFAPGLTEIPSGGLLKLVNKTGELHTFSIVTKNEVPRTNHQIKHCFDAKPVQICKEISRAHKKASGGFRSVVDNGKPGLDTPFVLPKMFGDSLFLKPTKKPEITVSASPNRTLFFICAIHPFMHGRIKVSTPAP